MALPASGPISMADLAAELGLPAGSKISLNDPAVRALANKPSGKISMSDFYAASARVPINLTISANTTNYNIRSNMPVGYVAGKSDITLTINSGVYVYATSTSNYGLTVGAFATGDTVTVVNNGIIMGRGGAGGAGTTTSGGAGGKGGTAFYTAFPTNVNNIGTIGGGGGGGGAGGREGIQTWGSGGGGGGRGNGAGGASGGGTAADTAGTAGTLTANGVGGASGVNSNGAGGRGGTLGSAGVTGTGGVSGGANYAGGAGGGAGNCTIGNAYITWIATGTRNGPLN